MASRRHYRVAQKEAQQPDVEIFAKRHHHFILQVIIFSIIIFVKGFIIGYFVHSKYQS